MQHDNFVGLGILAAALAMVSIGVAADDVAESPKEFERVEWLGKVEEGDIVVVDNPYGDVRLRFGGYHGAVEVVSLIQLLRKDGAYLEVRPEVVENGLLIRPVWTMKPGLDLPVPLEGDRSRVDLAVLVPLGVRLEVKTADGLVEAQGVRSDTDIQTDSGEIRIRKHQAAVNASSNNGRIEAVLLKDATTEVQTFRTRTGSIEVWLAADAAHQVVVTTSGAITTDFSINVEHLTGAEPDKRAVANIAAEGPKLLLSSLRGPVALRRLVEVHDGTANASSIGDREPHK